MASIVPRLSFPARPSRDGLTLSGLSLSSRSLASRSLASRSLASLCLAGLLLAGLLLANEKASLAAEPSDSMTLRMLNGDYVQGQWVAVEAAASGSMKSDRLPGTVQWRSSAFAAPLSVPWEQIQSIQLPVAEPRKLPGELFEFELVSGESVYGALKSLSMDSIEIDSKRLGLLKIPRRTVRQFFANQNAETVISGPQGLLGWYSARPKDPQFGMNPWANNPNIQVEWVRSTERLKQWGSRESPSTSSSGAQLRSEFELPAKARIELELSWQTKAAFAVAIGASLDGNRDRTAFRLEVWGQELVLAREDDESAEVRPLMTLPSGNGSVRLQLLYDRAANRLIVFSGGGQALADLTFIPKPKANGTAPGRQRPQVQRAAKQLAEAVVDIPGKPGAKEVIAPIPERKEPTELAITNVLGDLRIDAFRVSAWNGVAPGSIELGKPRIERTDGRQEVAEVIAFDAGKNEVRLKDGMGERTEPLTSFSQIVLSEQRSAPLEDGLMVHLHAGDRLFGLPLPSQLGRLRLRHASFEQPLDISVADIRSVSVMVKSATRPAPSNRVLQWNGGSLEGQLVDGRKTNESTGLIWKAVVAVSPTALNRDFSGRIIARSQDTRDQSATTSRNEDAQVVGVAGGLVVGFARVARGLMAAPANAPANAPGAAPADGNGQATNGTQTATSSTTPGPYKIHLRSGEVIPCQKLAIDEQGLRLESNVSSTQRIAHSQIKAIEMLPGAKPPAPVKVKRERLLMIPRVSRDNPPTHIVRSRDADYLRGRLLEMNEQSLTMEVRTETKRVPRELVSHIIWINPDEVGASASEAKGSGEGASVTPPQDIRPLSVLALRTDGVRIGFEPTGCQDGVLFGTNPNLGEVRVDVREVDEFLIGAAVGEASAKMPYSRWRWTAATLPKVASASGNSPSGSRAPGTDSPLVGKPAPEFKLPMLVGKEAFELGKQRGRIVVLDFWATWCGPCLKTIPVLDKVVRELPPEAKVDLIAVNLEETPKQITSLLERQKWKMAVALDQDGAVAAKYAATAIPQTVIIDREGKVASLFVGGGPQFEADLRAAIAALLNPGPSK